MMATDTTEKRCAYCGSLLVGNYCKTCHCAAAVLTPGQIPYVHRNLSMREWQDVRAAWDHLAALVEDTSDNG